MGGIKTMKKLYNSPYYVFIQLYDKDVITTSGAEVDGYTADIYWQKTTDIFN